MRIRIPHHDDTIAAIATPPGLGGVAIVRLSGAKARALVKPLFSKDPYAFVSHTAHLGNFLTREGKFIDTLLLLYMEKGRSYTGEETVELHCHGGSLIAKTLLECLFREGARPAEPGEFTFRAFLNGKIDLAQAEAVQALIAAKNSTALAAAQEQLSGHLSARIRDFQSALTDVAGILEAWVDFPEEGLEFASEEELCGRLRTVIDRMEQLARTFSDGRLAKEGVRLCLLGAPNVGKSSLMNALLDQERAIVTPIPGTTRDILEEQLTFGGLHFCLVDTAGVRQTEEVIEREGIERSKRAMGQADLVLLVLDATRPGESQALDFLAELDCDRTILVWNKIDLASPPATMVRFFPHQVALSAEKRLHLDALRQKIESLVWHSARSHGEELLLTEQRHHTALLEAIEHANTVLQGLQSQISPEFITSDMRACLYALGRIIGSNVGEEILSAIFSRFCIGK